MALADKNIVITPNTSHATNVPQIVFSGADAVTGPQNITLRMYPTSGGTLAFEGSTGQLLSITNSTSSTLFSVNDISGVPSIEVTSTGLVKIAEFADRALFGTSIDDGINKIQVTGSVKVSQEVISKTYQGMNYVNNFLLMGA
jgi:hypothetical protein